MRGPTELRAVLHEAQVRGTAVPAFNVTTLEQVEAVVSAAERSGAPTILQLSERTIRFHGGLHAIVPGIAGAIRLSSARVWLHLDHMTDYELIARGLDYGVPSVMVDASQLPFEENVRAACRVLQLVGGTGGIVEAELGHIGGKGGAHATGARTDPDEAARFVEASGVDLLAVAIGSTHAQRDRTSRLDIPLLTEIRARVSVPLVLHGSSGVPDDEILRAVKAGIAKVNMSTHLNLVFTRAAATAIETGLASDPRDYLGPARDAFRDEAARIGTLLAPPST